MNLLDALKLKLWQRENKVNSTLIQGVLLALGEDFCCAHFEDLMGELLASQKLKQIPKLLMTQEMKLPSLSSVEKEAERLMCAFDEGDRVIAVGDECYPKLLRSVGKERPILLFARGKMPEPLLNERAVLCVVGSRNKSLYGEEVIRALMQRLDPRSVLHVSGLAKGMDARSHEQALKKGLRSVAVLPCSVTDCYPHEHQSLKKEIEATGLSLSEYLPGDRPERWRFVERNRILSGLSHMVLVVEAGLKSGALITARHAADQGRDVFAVPGSIFSRQSAGCLELLEDGVSIYVSPERFCEAFYERAKQMGVNVFMCCDKSSDEDEQDKTIEMAETLFGPWNKEKNTSDQLLLMLQKGAMSAPELGLALKIDAGELRRVLSRLEVQGRVKRSYSGYTLTRLGAQSLS